MAREAAKAKILAIVARNDGELGWYAIDHALSGSAPDCVGPFMDEINELSAGGLIEIRENAPTGTSDTGLPTKAVLPCNCLRFQGGLPKAIQPRCSRAACVVLAGRQCNAVSLSD
jgi:hypothetical protein